MIGPVDAWDAYLERFHAARPGITERVLTRSIDEHGSNPYDWVAERIPQKGLVVDVACGSAPLWSDRLDGHYLGIDASDAEVELARRRGANRLVVGSAVALPVESGTAAAVVCSMALMILPDLPAVLAEVRRVLGHDGELVAIMPTAPRGARDVVFGVGLIAAARSSLGYRNDAVLHHPRRLLADHGLDLVDDAHRSYRFDLRADDAVTDAAASLYLRGAGSRDVRRVERYLQRTSRAGRGMPVPIRRIVARARE